MRRRIPKNEPKRIAVLSAIPAVVAIPIAVKRTSGKRAKIMFRPGRFLSDAGSELTQRQIAFGKALDEYKRKSHNPFPAFSEVLDVVDANLEVLELRRVTVV